ncbi:MAG: hypothetical protein Q9169_007139 [Polycauliona sp. 2 TL-2023]
MALPYPEGEVFSRRKLLKYPGFAMDTDDKAFYSNVLVETMWNGYFNSGLETVSTKPHIRANYVTGFGEWYTTQFGVWGSQSVLFGDNNMGEDISREVVLGKNTNFNSIRDRAQGGPARFHLQPVTIGPEKYMYLDLTVPVRAVYFPLAHQASAVNNELCSYLMVDFRLRKGVKMRSRDSGKTYDVPFSYSHGLGIRAYESLCFDIQGIYAYLALPQKMRNLEKGLYQTAEAGNEVIILWGAGNINSAKAAIPKSSKVSFDGAIDLAKVISDNFGVDVCYPESFTAKNVLKLSPDTLVAVCSSAAAMKGNIPKGFSFTKFVKTK